jgi:hypothetical protein
MVCPVRLPEPQVNPMQPSVLSLDQLAMKLPAHSMAMKKVPGVPRDVNSTRADSPKAGLLTDCARTCTQNQRACIQK